MAIQVFFESTTPLLHLLGCLKIAGCAGSRAYLAAGLCLANQLLSHGIRVPKMSRGKDSRTAAALRGFLRPNRLQVSVSSIVTFTLKLSVAFLQAWR